MTRRVMISVAAGSVMMAGVGAGAAALDLPELSPRARVMQTVGVTEITVDYASPAVRGRKIFGGLVPFGELWRTGANAATTIELSHAATIGGAVVPAGTYAVFTIPGEKQWTIILNTNPNQGGTRSYDADLDQVRFEVTPAAAPARERMTFLFTDTTDRATRLDLSWAGTRVSVPIAVDTAAHVDAAIEDAVAGAAADLAAAARHRAAAGDLDEAVALIDKSLAVEAGWFNHWIKADILAQQGAYGEAYPHAEAAWELGQQADYFFFEGRVKQALEDWKDKR